MPPMDESETLRYQYSLMARQSKWFLVLPWVMFACGGMVAHGVDSGLPLFGVVDLTIEQTRWFFWIGSGMFGAVGILVIVMRVRNVTQELVIADEFVDIPRGLINRKTTRVPFQNISQLEELKVVKNRIFRIYTTGKNFIVNESWMPSEHAYFEALDTLRDRVRHYRFRVSSAGLADNGLIRNRLS